mgnify:CR=1 FL=1
MTEKKSNIEYFIPPELRPLTRKVKPYVKGLNTGIAQLAGMPVDLINISPVLLDYVIPGDQGLKPFLKKPVGGSQTFKDLMAAGNIGTYKDVESIPKEDFGAGVAGMLSSETFLGMFPVKKAIDAIMTIKKGKKDALPVPTAGGVDLSKRDFLKKAPVAVAGAAMVPPVLREIGEVIPTTATTKAAKVGLKGVIGSAAAKANKLRDLYFGTEKALKGKGDPVDQLSQSLKRSEEMDAVTTSMNKELSDFVKGKNYDDFMKLKDEELIALGEIQQDITHVMRTGTTPKDVIYSGAPLREKTVSEALGKAIDNRGLRGEITDLSRARMFESIAAKREARKRAGFVGKSGIDLPSSIIPKMFPSGTTAKTTSLFPTEAKKGKQLLIVSCGSKKCPDVGNMKALDRYLGPIFQSIKKAGVPENVDVAILSAKHGLIRADTPIKNYDQLMTKDRVKDFLKSNFEISKIRETMQGYDNVLVQGGDNYKNVIKSAAGDIPYTEVPKGRGIGDQRSFIANYLKDQDKESIPDLGNIQAVKQGGSGVEKKAEGGIAGLSDVARDMFKGPKGIGAYKPFMVG